MLVEQKSNGANLYALTRVLEWFSVIIRFVEFLEKKKTKKKQKKQNLEEDTF
jgi:hypothetical protein